MTDVFVGIAMMLVWGISILYPWHPSWPHARSLIHLPWLLIPLFVLYELLVPREMNIRLDWLLIAWAFGIAFLIYAIRLIVFWRLRKSNIAPNG